MMSMPAPHQPPNALVQMPNVQYQTSRYQTAIGVWTSHRQFCTGTVDELRQIHSLNRKLVDANGDLANQLAALQFSTVEVPLWAHPTHQHTVDEVKRIHSLSQKLVDSTGDIARHLGELHMTLVRSNAETVTELKANRRLLEVGTLQWAIANASIGAFMYDTFPLSYTATSSNSPQKRITSEHLVRDILSFFMMGQGMSFEKGKTRDIGKTRRHRTEDAYHQYIGSLRTKADIAALERSEVSDFLDRLKRQIFQLTGQHPRVEEEREGDKAYYVIWQR
jgi:hypothetical protein